MRCRADGPNSTIYCDKIISKKPYANKHGVKGFEIYMNQLRETTIGGKTTVTNIAILGPLYVLDVQMETKGKIRGLYIAESYGHSDPINSEILKELVETLRF